MLTYLLELVNCLIELVLQMFALGLTGYYCTPLTARFCLINHIPYNYTMFPNIFGLGYREADVVSLRFNLFSLSNAHFDIVL